MQHFMPRVLTVFMCYCLMAVASLGIAKGFQTPAQGVLTGTVVSADSQQPLARASIRVVNSARGTATNAQGQFTLTLPANVNVQVSISFVGYVTDTLNINLAAGQTQNLTVKLKATSRVLQDVVVNDRVEDPEERQQVSFTRLDPQNAAFLPGAQQDISKLISSLPGVASNNELSTTYNVRGGNYDENLVYVNDIQVYRPFLIRAGRQEGLSFVNPDLTGSLGFSAGGWQAKYGDKLSSVLNVYYKEPDSSAASASIGLLGGSGHIEGANKSGRLTYVAGVRHKSLSYLLNTLETEGQYFPRFTDAQAYISYDLQKATESKPARTQLGFLFNYARNRYLTRPEGRETDFGTLNNALRLFVDFIGQELMEFDTYQGGLKLEHRFSNKFKSSFVASAMTTTEREFIDVEGGYLLCNVDNNPNSANFNNCAIVRGIGTQYNYARNQLEANIYTLESRNLWFPAQQHQVEFGAGLSHQRIDDVLDEYSFLDSADFIQVEEIITSTLNLYTTRFWAYAQHSWQLGARQRLTYGVRAHYWNLNEQLLISPRLQFSHQPRGQRDVLLKFAVGLYQQPPFYRELRDFDGNLNQDLKAQSSLHLIGGLDYNFTMWQRPFKFTAEAYYKDMWNVVPYEIDNVRLRYFAENNANAFAAGIDMRVNGEFIRGTESWFSLGLLNTREDILDDDRGSLARPSDQRFRVGVFFQDYLPNNPSWRVYLGLNYASALPFGPPRNEPLRNFFRGEPFRRADVGFSKLISLTRKQGLGKYLETLWISAEVLNLFGADNPVSYLWINDVAGGQQGVPNSLTARFFNLRLVARYHE